MHKVKGVLCSPPKLSWRQVCSDLLKSHSWVLRLRVLALQLFPVQAPTQATDSQTPPTPRKSYPALQPALKFQLFFLYLITR